jgi:hypothetical protein
MSKTIVLSDREVVVEKLPLKKYVDVFNAIGKLPKELEQLSGKSNEELFNEIPSLIASFLPQVVGILSVATGLKKQEIEELGLDEATDLFVAVIEVNNVSKVVDNIKKLTARQTDNSTKPLTS